MLRRASYIGMIVALFCAGTLPVAWGANSRYQQGKVRRVKACVGLIGTMGEPPAVNVLPDPDAIDRARTPNPNPYLFYVLDQRKDLKPDGWEFYNPAAPPFPTAAQVARWSTSAPTITAATPLKSDMGPYWEVLINQANYDRLAQMDVIYIPIARTAPTHFTEEQRRVLTRLADSGVTIWVDWALDAETADGALGGTEAPGAPPTLRRKNAFFTNADFADANGVATVAAGHPLLTEPFNLAGEFTRIGKGYGANGSIPPSTNRVVETRAPDLQPTMNLAAVVPTTATAPNRTFAYIAAGRFGAGYVVVTAGNVGKAIADLRHPVPHGTDNDFTATNVGNADLSQAEPEDLKFAYNLCSWAAEVTATQKNGRHTGQSSVALDGAIEQGNYPHLVQVGPSFQTYPPNGMALPVNPAAPLVVNGVVVAAVRTGNDNELVALESNPNDDFDGNGYIDDPIQASDPATHPLADYSIGQNYDRLDRFALGANTVYGMIAGELPAGGSLGSAAYIFAAGSLGIVSAPVPIRGVATNWGSSPIMPGATLGMAISGSPAFALNPGPLGSLLTQAKLYVGGIQQASPFGGGNNGKVAGLLVNPANGALAPEWYYPPRSEPNRLGPVAGSLTTAQLMDTATGAVDTMVFATTAAPNLGAGANAGQQGEASGGAYGWITATRGDPLAFPMGNTAGGGANPTAGRRFVSARWVNLPQGRRAPDPREITWDVNKHYEIRVMDKSMNYVLARFVPGTPGFNVLTGGAQSGQVELPEPSAANGLNQFSMDPSGMDARLRNQWNLNDFVLLADYSFLPMPIDTGLSGEATLRPRFTPATPYVRATANTVEQTGAAGGVAVGRDNLAYYATGKGYMCAVEWKRGVARFRWKILGVQSWGDQDLSPGSANSQNVDPTTPGYLADANPYRFVASPAAGNRVVFASRNGTAYIFEPDATIRFKLTNILNPMQQIPWTAGLGEEVVLEGDHGQGILPNNRAVMSRQTPFGREREQFVVDPDTGTATFLNMENFSLDLSQAVSPHDALTTFGVDTGGRPAVRIRWWFRSAPVGLPSAGAPAEALVPLPLVAVYRPTTPAAAEGFFSGAVLTSDKIFLQGTSGWLHELPLDPKMLDPSFPRRGAAFPGLQGFDLGSLGLRRVKNVAAGLFSVASPAVTQGMLVTNTPRGLTMFSSPNVVIADSNRIVEASGNSTALASTDVVTKHRMDISEFAIPTDPGFANTTVNGVARPLITERRPISRAAVVKKLDRRSSLTGLFSSATITDAPIDGVGGIKESPEWAESSYLVADPGNNRIIEFNPAGKAVWECDQIFDPMDYIPAGEPLKLSQPMDVQRWVETEVVGGTTIYVIHTLIADTGNNRIVEVVDKVQYTNGNYGPNSFVVVPGQVGSDGQPFRWYHVVVWSSQTNAQGLRLRYRTAQRVYWPDASGNRIPLTSVAGAPGTPAGQATPTPPYLPVERAVTYVMATVQGQQLTYSGQVQFGPDYFRRYTAPNRGVIERKPNVSAGPDSVVFLRDKFRLDDASGQLQYVPDIREAYPMGTPVTADQYRYAQGVVDPNLPIITRINDEAGGGNRLHDLNGVGSVQLTVRSDVKFAPSTFGGSPMVRLPYLLIADTDGVWETRLIPGPATNAMAWAFTVEDYAYATGAGNGNPAALYSTTGTDHQPGGRRLNAVSARRLQSGLVLITSRMPANEQPRGNLAAGDFTHLNIGADVFMLRATDFRTLQERGGAAYDRRDVSLHGWQADQWVQTVYTANVPALMRGAPSIRWRAAEQLDPSRPPTLRTQISSGANPNPAELTGSYIPAQPNYADIAY